MNEQLQSYVEQWLRIAARDLCNDAWTIVRAEVEEHVSIAFGEMRCDGVDALMASRKAVDALGDPKSAKRRYHRIYLTHAEDRRLTLFAKTSRSTVAAGWGAVLFVAILFLIDRPHSTSSVIFYLFFLATILIGALTSSWLQYMPRSVLVAAKFNAAERTAGFLIAAVFATAVTWQFTTTHGWNWFFVAVMGSLAVLPAITAYRQIRLLAKLTRNSKDQESC